MSKEWVTGPRVPGKITLIVADTGPQDRIKLIVRDTGGGIREDAFSGVFEPFFTTKTTGKGTGLGLSISYGIITEMGGSLRPPTPITAQRSRLACRWRIPQLADGRCQGGLAARERSAARYRMLYTMTAKYRILIVDDEDDSCWELAKFLSDKGYDADEARDEAKARWRLEMTSPDLTISDLQVPPLVR